MNPKNFKVCIGLLTKDSAKWLPRVLKNAEEYASLFKDYAVYIVDGHSKDNTTILCTSWCKQDPEHRLFVVQPSKIARDMSLVEARTMVVNHFRSQFAEDVLLLLLDTDSVNAKPLDVAGFLTCFERDDWDALFANQPTKYYDIWALRDSQCPTDYQFKFYNGAGMEEINADLEIFSKAKPKELGFWPVQSAFGGAGMYRTHKINSKCFYGSLCVFTTLKGTQLILPMCEHVPFNQGISQAGGKLFINCKWMISDHEEAPPKQQQHETASHRQENALKFAVPVQADVKASTPKKATGNMI